MIFIVTKITEPDYGCEERPDNYVKIDKVLIRSEEGEEILDDKNINEGDWVYFDVHNEIYKE